MAAITTANTTLEYYDGFDDYSIGQMTRYWTTINAGGSTVSISGGNGRNGTNSLRFVQASGTGNYTCNVTITLTSQSTRTVGFAFKVAFLPNSSTALIALYDVGTSQLDVRLNVDGTFSVTRAGTVLSTTSFSINPTIYYYIEFTSVINNTTGSYQLNVGGISRTSGTGVNTRNSANNSANVIVLGPSVTAATNPGTLDFDDFYSRADGTFCGDVRSSSVLPTGNGALSQLTPLTGSNWQEVKDNPSDDDVSYNVAATSGLEDLYTYPALPSTSGTVFGVMTIPVMRNDSAGTVTVTSVYHISGTDYAGGTQTIGSTTYAPYMDIQGENPATSAAWTVSAINSAQFGINRTT